MLIPAIRRISLVLIPGSVLLVSVLYGLAAQYSEPYAFGCHKGVMHYGYGAMIAVPVLAFTVFVAAVVFRRVEESRGDLAASGAATLVVTCGVLLTHLVAWGGAWKSSESLSQVVF